MPDRSKRRSQCATVGRESPSRCTISDTDTRIAERRTATARARLAAAPALRSRLSSERSASVGSRTKRLGTSGATHHLSLEGPALSCQETFR
jgi:hypothetical protein